MCGIAKRLLALLAAFLSAVTFLRAGETHIVVKGQEAFDKLSATLAEALRQGEGPVVVDIRKGTYYYREKHLTLNGLYCPRREVTLLCNGSLFLPEGPDYRLQSRLGEFSASCQGPYDPGKGWVDLDRAASCDLRAQVGAALSRPEVVDRKSGLCRFRAEEADLSEEEARETLLLLTQWYRGMTYPLKKIQGGYVYFTSPKLTADGNPQTDIDADYKFEKQLPRYILLNRPGADLYMRDGILYGRKRATLHQCDACCFLSLLGCTFASFTLQDARFVGNADGECLLRFYAVEGTVVAVKGCRFEGVRSDVVHVQRTMNFLFADNTVTRTYRSGITVDFFSPGAEIAHNRFSDTGWMLDNDFCVEARGSWMWIHHNVFENFSYGAIGVGTHFRETMPPSASGVIEENECYQTEAFRQHPARLLMDSGAIYTWTVNKDIRIRNNYIHDIGGYGQNRGIFCDDGTVNVHISGNRVLRIRNYYCIDLRLCPQVEKDPQSRIHRVNVGNSLENNEVDGPVRFQNRDE